MSTLFDINDFKIYNGVCDGLTTYTNRGYFVELEIACQRITASLNELKRTRGLEYVTKGEFHNGEKMCLNYLFKY